MCPLAANKYCILLSYVESMSCVPTMCVSVLELVCIVVVSVLYCSRPWVTWLSGEDAMQLCVCVCVCAWRNAEKATINLRKQDWTSTLWPSQMLQLLLLTQTHTHTPSLYVQYIVLSVLRLQQESMYPNNIERHFFQWMVSSHADSFGFMCWGFQISGFEISPLNPSTMEVNGS